MVSLHDHIAGAAATGFCRLRAVLLCGEGPAVSARSLTIQTGGHRVQEDLGAGAAPPWVPLINTYGAVWQSTGPLLPPPYDVQLTAADGSSAAAS